MQNTTPPAPDKSSKPIDELILHVGEHVDEYEGTRRVFGYGEPFFPGCAKAQVRFTLGMPARPDAEFDREKKLPIGCGGGRFDEHRAEGRLPGECATTLVSAYLGLNADPVLKRMADEVLRCDTKPGVWLTELPELTKMFHRRLKNADGFILRWALKALQAIHCQLCYCYAPVAGEKGLLEIFEELVKKKHFPQNNLEQVSALASMRQQLEESAARKDRLIFELAFIVEALHRTGVVKPEDVVEWVRFPLDHLFADQVEFAKCVKFCKELQQAGKSWHRIIALCGRRERKLWLFFCMTDMSVMQRAARYSGAHIVILRNSQGQVSVFTRSTRGLNLANFTRMVRWLELPDKDAAEWDALGQEGTHPLVPEWYYFPQAGQLLNGSLTHPNTPATQMSSEAVLEVARCAFHPEGVRRWKKAHGVRSQRRVRVERRGKTARAGSEKMPPTQAQAGLNNLGAALDKALAPEKAAA